MASNPNMGIIPSQVEIHVSCQNLINKDVVSKSDPMVVLFSEQRNNDGKFWKEYGRTETIQDNLNPKFVKSFHMEYHFEQHQNLKFEVYDSDSSALNLTKHDYLGHKIITLGNIMGEYCGKVTKPLVGRDNKDLSSTINFIAEEMSESKEMLLLQFNGKKLDKKDFFGSSDPFLIIYRHGVENNAYIPVYQTEIIENNLNPSWKAFEVSLVSLCNGDKLRPIKIECYDWDSDGSHDFIGECNVTVDEMLSKENFPKEFINPKKCKKKSYKHSGMLHLVRIESRKHVSFLDYITGGIEICFHVAIDFTASNGDPNRESSLHFIRRDAPNQYAQALLTVGKICEDYDSDKLMPAYGFGARIRGQVYHDFHLNQMENPDCYGVLGILEAYQRFLPTAELYGPTNFSPIINLVTNIAHHQSVIKKYHILLILTDGVITDMIQTKLAIINASYFPISIIIVGIGNADFNAMDELDSDEGRLKCQGRIAEHDIVQFVPFSMFCGRDASEELAKEVLMEVPNQLVTYMKKHGIKPQPSLQMTGEYDPHTAHFLPNIGNQGNLQEQPDPIQLSGAPSCPNQVLPLYPNQVPAPYPNQGIPSFPNQGIPSYPNQGIPSSQAGDSTLPY